MSALATSLSLSTLPGAASPQVASTTPDLGELSPSLEASGESAAGRREHLIRRVMALLACHYPMAVVLAEIADLSSNPRTTVAALEELVQRLEAPEGMSSTLPPVR